MSSPFYDKLLADLEPGLPRRVLEVLTGHIGKENRIDRARLTYEALRLPYLRPKSTDDRKVRLAIAQLQALGYPVLSDSGQGGYWLGKPEEIQAYIAELASRKEALEQKINALRRANRYAWADPNKAVQDRLF